MDYSDSKWFSLILSKKSFDETLWDVLRLKLDRDALSQTFLVLDALTNKDLSKFLKDREVHGLETIEPISQARIKSRFFTIDGELYDLLQEKSISAWAKDDLEDLSIICSDRYVIESIFHHESIFCLLSEQEKIELEKIHKLQPVIS